ncbi:MAG: nodulation protein NfeD [Bacteroidales bacterium]|nr:nodulation protein NfeD [Bacteroidales bacterium]
MKNYIRLLLSAVILLSCTLVSFAENKGTVFVIPVETEIDNSAFHHFRRALTQADEAGASLVMLRLNTYGGALDAADSIRTALLRLNIPTVAFVDVNAASAGALIALACDSVYMAPGASMGSATVVNGAGEPMPEKYQSYMSTIMRATAEHHGLRQEGDTMIWRRDPAIAASMVNPTESVSLTGSQAIECGYADGIASNIGEVLEQLDREGARVEYYNSSLSDDILGFLSNAAVRAVLVMLILGGIYMEMHTPGLGVAAAVSTVAAVLYFIPMIAGGAIPAWVLLLFIAGVVLIALEIFVVPGFGVCGISGILAVAAALVGAIMANDAVTGIDLSSFGRSIAVVGAGSIAAIAIVWYLTSSHGPKCFRRHSELMTELKVSDGFVGVDMGPAKYIGQYAETVTVLRPAGKIEIGDKIFDAVSTGDFIQPHRRVKILRYENAQLYVIESTHES